VTSVGGVITFTILSINQRAPVAPNWPTGIALGVGGLGQVEEELERGHPQRRLVGART